MAKKQPKQTKITDARNRYATATVALLREEDKLNALLSVRPVDQLEGQWDRDKAIASRRVEMAQVRQQGAYAELRKLLCPTARPPYAARRAS